MTVLYPTVWTRGIPPEIHVPDAEVLTELLKRVRRRGMVVLEVGSWVGNGSTRLLGELLREVNGTLYCVDTWAGSDNVKHHLDYRQQLHTLFPVFAENVWKFGLQDVVKPLVMPSLEASQLFPAAGIDMIFIDGHHGYNHVKQDLLAWLPKVKPGGIFCGHDAETGYLDLHPALRAAIESASAEADVFVNNDYPGPPNFHAGVIRAVHEVLGTRAQLWCKQKPTTIWSYQVPANWHQRWRSRYLPSRQTGPQIAATPWPERGFLPLEQLDSYQGYHIVRRGPSYFGIPQTVDRRYTPWEEACQQAGALTAASREELERRIDATRTGRPIEFAGWLPVYADVGNCGQHPQFKHTSNPPPGYRFTYSAPLYPPPAQPLRAAGQWLRERLQPLCRKVEKAVRPVFTLLRGGPGLAPWSRLRMLRSAVRMFCQLRRQGAGLSTILLFLRTRHFLSQAHLTEQRGLVFLPSIPFTYGQNPWLIEIEDPTTLFFPFVHNGHTNTIHLAEQPYFPIIKALLEAEQCRGIVTHMHSTARLVAKLFRSETIRNKVFYAPLGVHLPQRWQRHEATADSEPIHLLFTNSWHQLTQNFFLRGGLDVLEAFAILHERYPQLRLTLRTQMPVLGNRYQQILEQGWVRVISRFLPTEEMEELLAGSHIYLLPAARVHIVSVLQAMSHGLAVVASDGWGFEEYVDHDRNGLMVKGRQGKVSWIDEEAGMLREIYQPMYEPDPIVVAGIVEAVSRLVEDRSLRQRLGQTARRDVQTKYNLENWNAGLKAAFDTVLPPTAAPDELMSARYRLETAAAAEPAAAESGEPVAALRQGD